MINKDIFAVGFIPKRQLNNESGFKVTNNLSLGKKIQPAETKFRFFHSFQICTTKADFFFYTLTKPDNTRRQPEFTQSCIFQQ